jgi:hypothetical protein
MRCLQLDQEERQRYRLPYSRSQRIKAIVMEGGRRKPGLRERTATASRETMVDATGIEPVTLYHVKKAREVEAVKIQCPFTSLRHLRHDVPMMFHSAGRT